MYSQSNYSEGSINSIRLTSSTATYQMRGVKRGGYWVWEEDVKRPSSNRQAKTLLQSERGW